MNNSNESFNIRDAAPTDWAAANFVHKSVFPDDKYIYANNIAAPGTINLVATKDNQIVGFISVLVNQPNPNEIYLWQRMRPYIGFLGVLEEYRKFGVGSALIKEASRKALVRTNENYIYLECEPDNKKVQRLYERIGFRCLTTEEVEETFGRPPHAERYVYRAPRQVLSL